MMSARILRLSTAAFALATGAMLAADAQAQQVAQQMAAAAPTNVETVVVTGTAFNPEVAPAKASLDATQPQTIINKSYIEDSVAGTGTYDTLHSAHLTGEAHELLGARDFSLSFVQPFEFHPEHVRML